jgi:antitoxin component YwqK of YwqJK toxin-antitoxin module
MFEHHKMKQGLIHMEIIIIQEAVKVKILYNDSNKFKNGTQTKWNEQEGLIVYFNVSAVCYMIS